MNQLTLSVKQGEELSVPFTIQADGIAMDLTDAVILVQVKASPYKTTTPMFEKEITITSDPEVDGQITYPLEGKFELRLNEADTSYQPSDYYLVIFVDINDEKRIRSSKPSYNAIYRVCTQ